MGGLLHLRQKSVGHFGQRRCSVSLWCRSAGVNRVTAVQTFRVQRFMRDPATARVCCSIIPRCGKLLFPALITPWTEMRTGFSMHGQKSFVLDLDQSRNLVSAIAAFLRTWLIRVANAHIVRRLLPKFWEERSTITSSSSPVDF